MTDLIAALREDPPGRALLDLRSHSLDLDKIVLAGLHERLANDEVASDYAGTLSELHQISDIYDNIEKYRQYLFSIFRTAEFQRSYQHLGRIIIDRWFDKDALLQVTPTARIQPANGGRSVSFHTDGWYGHGQQVTSFWVPLVDVAGSNSLHMATDLGASQRVIDQIESQRLDLAAVNDLASAICEPVTAGPGDVLAFASSMLHGTVENQTAVTRVSFDFRIAAHERSIGTKPRANYRSLDQLDDSSNEAEIELGSAPPRRAMMYSGICRAVTAKAQLVFLHEYAKLNSIEIGGSESEIVTMAHAPVLRHYLRPQNGGHDSVLAFSIDLLPEDQTARAEILQMAVENDIELIFGAEDISVRSADDIVAVEALIASIREV